MRSVFFFCFRWGSRCYRRNYRSLEGKNFANYIIPCDFRDIYNADEFGLLYRALPTKSMHLKSGKCSGCRKSKIRLTGLAVANMRGEKILVFVIGRSKNLRCFKKIRRPPCRYCAQKMSSMDSELFEQWVWEQDKKFALEERKVA